MLWEDSEGEDNNTASKRKETEDKVLKTEDKEGRSRKSKTRLCASLSDSFLLIPSVFYALSSALVFFFFFFCLFFFSSSFFFFFSSSFLSYSASVSSFLFLLPSSTSSASSIFCRLFSSASLLLRLLPGKEWGDAWRPPILGAKGRACAKADEQMRGTEPADKTRT